MESLQKRHLSFKEIADMQDKLNAKADKKNPDWRTARTYQDFVLAAVLEFAELIESAPWKWWKKAAATDWWNLKIEAIDMLHFMASAALLRGISEEDASYELGYQNGAGSMPIFDDEQAFINRDYAVDLLARVVTSSHDVKVIDEAMKCVGLEADEISAIYIAKYTLNEIRWAGGYDEGTYKKMKANGVEDNVFLKAIVDKFKTDESLKLADLSALVRETMAELA